MDRKITVVSLATASPTAANPTAANPSTMVALNPLEALRTGSADYDPLRDALEEGGLSTEEVNRLRFEYASADCLVVGDRKLGSRLVAIGLPLAKWEPSSHQIFHRAFPLNTYVVARILRTTAAEPSPCAYATAFESLAQRAKDLDCAALGVWAPAPGVQWKFRRRVLQDTLASCSFTATGVGMPLSVSNMLVPHAAWQKPLTEQRGVIVIAHR